MSRQLLSTGKEVDDETLWARSMAAKYGAGNFNLFRPLYKDLCDEMRREYYTKPPPPYTCDESSSKTAVEVAADDVGASTNVETCARPAIEYGDGAWSVAFRPRENCVVFSRAAIRETRQGRVVAWGHIELKDPPRLNAMLTFADWIPVEVCVERNGIILHFSMAANEGGMHMRNVRVYEPSSEMELNELLDCTETAEWTRKRLYYDGPCLWHLELDVQNELYDVMQDHGITLDWMRWAASWIFYLEHVRYLWWNLGMLEELIPSSVRGPEDDFLLPREKTALDEPVEDWLDAHTL